MEIVVATTMSRTVCVDAGLAIENDSTDSTFIFLSIFFSHTAVHLSLEEL